MLETYVCIQFSVGNGSRELARAVRLPPPQSAGPPLVAPSHAHSAAYGPTDLLLPNTSNFADGQSTGCVDWLHTVVSWLPSGGRCYRQLEADVVAEGRGCC